MLQRNVRIKSVVTEPTQVEQEYDDGRTEKEFLQMSRRAVKRKNLPKIRLVKY